MSARIIRRRWRLAATALLALPAAAIAQGPDSGELRAALERLLAEPVSRTAASWAAGERVALERLYPPGGARALWLEGERPTRQLRELAAVLDGVEAWGLVPGDYDADVVRSLVASLAASRAAPFGGGGSAADLASLDVRASRSLVRLLRHLHAGRTDPRALRFELLDTHRVLDFAALALVTSRAPDLRAAVAAVGPPYAGYARLVRLRERYLALAADSALRAPPAVRAPVRPGQPYADAPALRRLLAALGDLAPGAGVVAATDSDRYDRGLADAVRAFQVRHGLEPDGVLGAATMAELRVPVARRLRQIDLTLERWRWLPDSAAPRFAVVNVPGFRLYAFEDDPTASDAVLAMNVIVGRAHARRHTPLFTGTMREVVFRPYWDVPPSIAANEVIPRIRREPAYAEREGFEIVRGGDVGAAIYPMTGANLSRVAAGSLRIRQRPGPANALGAVKFVFPNDHNVYLHGTPAVELFERARRDFSHGCIRVEDPAALAAWVLGGQDAWSATTIDSAMRAARTRRIRVERPVQVLVFYATVVVTPDDVAFFHPDLYGHDAALERALGLPPAPSIAPRPLARR